METCASVFNAHVDWGLENKTWNKNKAHKHLYQKLRKQFPNLPSSIIQSTRDQALEALKRDKLKTCPRKKNRSGIRYNLRCISKRGNLITLSTLEKREKVLVNVPDKFKLIFNNWKFKGAVLLYIKRRDTFQLQLIFEAGTPAKVKEKEVIGIDRGIRHIAVTSDRKFFSSNKVRANKRKHLHNRKTLKAKGTRSAKRKLRSMSGREKRFSRDVNHCISKILARGKGTIFVLEDLTGIRTQKKKSKKFNKKLSNWSHHQLASFLEYKAEELGKSVVYIDPQYTSQTCNKCGVVESTNRIKSRYRCKNCGYRDHADINAAMNIRERYLSQLPSNRTIEQAVVNQPNVTNNGLVTSLHPCGGGH